MLGIPVNYYYCNNATKAATPLATYTRIPSPSLTFLQAILQLDEADVTTDNPSSSLVPKLPTSSPQSVVAAAGNFFSAAFENRCTAVAGASGGIFGLLGLFIADMVLNFETLTRCDSAISVLWCLQRKWVTTLQVGPSLSLCPCPYKCKSVPV